MLKKLVLVIVVAIFSLMLLSAQIEASSVAIAEFETDRQFSQFRSDLDNRLLDHVVENFDGQSFEVKERLREIDLLRERSLSSNERRELRQNLQADFLVLPRLVDIKIDEQDQVSISLSTEGSNKISFGVKKVAVEVELSARVVDLRTGSIKTGFTSKREEVFSVSSVSINRRNIFNQKADEIVKDAINPATEEIAFSIIMEIEDLVMEKEAEGAKIVEIAPHGIEEYVIAKITGDSSNVRSGSEITFYKPGSVGGRIPVADGEIIDRDGKYITIKLLEKPKVGLEVGDTLQTDL